VGLTRLGRLVGLCVLAVLALLAVDADLVGYTAANPYVYTGEVPPDQETYPPVITITSPVNNTAYNTSIVPFTFNVDAPQSRTASSSMVQSVTYKADWQKEPINVLNSGQEHPSFNLQFSFVPEGQHSIEITVVGNGLYKQAELTYKWFFIRSTMTISFTIDLTAPTISVLSPENLSTTSMVPLNFTVNEVCSKIVYSLNGQQNVTVSGNSTLPHLPAGQYNVTFYAWDSAGNLGTSETANFTVAEIPPTPKTADSPLILPAAVVFSTVVILGVALLLKKRHSASR
jgi:hypothetical protein